MYAQGRYRHYKRERIIEVVGSGDPLRDGEKLGEFIATHTVSLTCGCGPWKMFVGTVELDGGANATLYLYQASTCSSGSSGQSEHGIYCRCTYYCTALNRGRGQPLND